jgi:hypothetical protein
MLKWLCFEVWVVHELDCITSEYCNISLLPCSCQCTTYWLLRVNLYAICFWCEYKGKKVKVKCTLVQALSLCTGRKAHWGSRGIALTFFDQGTRRGWGVSVTPRPLFTPGKDPVPILQEAGWAPGLIWTGAENLAPTGIRSQTVQPVASRYNNYAIRPTMWI